MTAAEHHELHCLLAERELLRVMASGDPEKKLRWLENQRAELVEVLAGIDAEIAKLSPDRATTDANTPAGIGAAERKEAGCAVGESTLLAPLVTCVRLLELLNAPGANDPIEAAVWAGKQAIANFHAQKP